MKRLLGTRAVWTLLAATAATVLVGSAVAQDRYEQNRYDSQRQYEADEERTYDSEDRTQMRDFSRSTTRQSERDWADSEQGQQRQRQARSSRDQQRQDQGARQLRVEPLGWVRVATDTTGDGRYDRVDWIYYYDLEIARERSQQRERESQGVAGRQGSGQQVRVRGEIQNMRRMNVDGEDAILATIETDQGETRRVCLKPADRLTQVDLQQGDRINVEGYHDQVNDRRVIMAQHLSVGGESVSLQRRGGTQRVRGEIVSRRTTRLDDREGRFVIARVRTEEGETRTVNLGPADEVEQLDLQQGDRITVMGRPGRIQGQSGLVAQQIQANDQTVRIGQAQQQRGQERSR